jgi:hypothetical protein
MRAWRAIGVHSDTAHKRATPRLVRPGRQIESRKRDPVAMPNSTPPDGSTVARALIYDGDGR